MSSAADREIRREIVKVLSRIENAWTRGRTEELRACFREDGVLVGPDLEHRLEGRGPIVDSYTEFLRDATMLAFHSGPPMVDVFGETAVAVTPWTAEYEIEGAVHSDAGNDLLVLTRGQEGWEVAWRTLVVTGAVE